MRVKAVTKLPLWHRAQIVPNQDIAAGNVPPQPPLQDDPHCLPHHDSWYKNKELMLNANQHHQFQHINNVSKQETLPEVIQVGYQKTARQSAVA